MLVLDDSSPSALAIDVRIPQSAAAVARAMVATWPRLEGRVQIERASIEDVELRPDDVIVSAHACGGLTDAVLTRAIDVRARVAEGDERETIWTKQKRDFPNFAEYETKTDRTIPVVVLERR
jgi:hypothetical protein